ncbi:hypothetical protein [Amycolatopsis pittospori]|uniref:hypothetical protein n=1 Tax=Amycolatopsis pittospori TaxID=2749434 RepID=UPI0015F0489B|nr:hypothetical protein [Amycolatopsis pittospori]
MGARLMFDVPTGRHARLNQVDRGVVALRRAASALRAAPKRMAALVAATTSLGFALGFMIAGVLL